MKTKQVFLAMRQPVIIGLLALSGFAFFAFSWLDAAEEPTRTGCESFTSYDEQIVSFSTLLNPLDKGKLSDLDKVKAQKEFRDNHIEICESRGHTTMTITHRGNSQKPINPKAKIPAKTVIQNEQLSTYDSSGKLIGTYSMTAHGAGLMAKLRASGDKPIPDIGESKGNAPSSQFINEMQKLGFKVLFNERLGTTTASNGKLELVIDPANNRMIRKEMENGRIKYSVETKHKEQNGSMIPEYRLEKWYEVSPHSNVCIVRNQYLKYTNYTTTSSDKPQDSKTRF